MMMFKNNQISQLQAKIKQLKREKAQLRAFLHEIIEAHYRVINQESEEPKEEDNHE
jgi:hypothetical protein